MVRRGGRRAERDLGSLARTAPDGPATCSTCAGEDLTKVPMVLTDGTDVVFVACGTCERREWFETLAGGMWEPIGIDAVLERSSRRG